MKQEELEILFSANEYLLKLIPGLEGIRKDIRDRKSDDSVTITELTDGMEGAAWLMEAFISIEECEKLGVDVDAMASNMESINEAIENEDYNLLADIIEYEIEPVIQGWLNELEKILRSGNYSM